MFVLVVLLLHGHVWGVHKSTSLMSSSLLLQQCPACLVRLTWIVFVIGGRWPYSWCLVGCCRQDLAITQECCVQSWTMFYIYIYIYIFILMNQLPYQYQRRQSCVTSCLGRKGWVNSYSLFSDFGFLFNIEIFFEGNCIMCAIQLFTVCFHLTLLPWGKAWIHCITLSYR